MTTATKTSKTFDQLSERDQKIITALKRGDTRGVVAQRHGITRERVRQISAPFSDEIETQRAAALGVARQQDREQGLSAVARLAKENPSMRVAALAAAAGGGVTTEDVVGVIGEEDALRRNLIRFVKDPVFTQKYSDEQCCEAIRAAARRLGEAQGKAKGEYGVLTMTGYAEYAQPDDPKGTTIQKRFGTWQVACAKAGVPSGDPLPSRVYEKKWSHEEMVAIMKQFFSEVGVLGSMRQYSDWARHVPKTPTLATVRAHFGSWTKVKEIAAEMAKSHSA